MPDFNVRSDSVNVEQIMEQIRARIREKRGVDYTEEQIRELAAVKLEKFLDPRGVRSDLLEQFKQRQPQYGPPADVPSLTFEDTTMFETHRGLLRFARRLLNPVLKLFFNPNAVIHALHTQAQINKAHLEREAARERQRRDVDGLYFEVIHNLVVELTRTGIEVKNLKMRVESLASRLEFNERRARALESAVVYKPSEPEPPPRSRPAVVQRPTFTPGIPAPSFLPAPAPEPQGSGSVEQGQPGSQRQQGQGGQPQGGIPGEGPGQRSRRRRRRRGRRGGGSAATLLGPSSAAPAADAASAGQADHGGDEGSTDDPESEQLDHLSDDGGPSKPEPGSDPGAQ